MVRSHPLEDSAAHAGWLEALDDEGIDALLVERTMDTDSLDASELPHIALLDLEAISNTAGKAFIERCDSLKLPVIALVSPDTLPDFDLGLGVSDFVVSPPDTEELVTRVKLTLYRNRHEEGDDVIRAGSLVINPVHIRGVAARQESEPQIQGVRATAAVGYKSRTSLFEGGATQQHLGLRLLRRHAHRWMCISDG